jgi:hypothetical protein
VFWLGYPVVDWYYMVWYIVQKNDPAWLRESFRGGVVRASAFHLWDRGFDSCYRHMWKESVNVLPKVVVFLRALRFPATGPQRKLAEWVRINIVRKVTSQLL